CDRGETGHHLGPGALLEQRRLRELAHILGGLEETERAAALGMDNPFRDALPIEMLHLLVHVVVLQQDRATSPHRERVLVAGGRDAGIGSRVRPLLVGHFVSLSACGDWAGGARWSVRAGGP